MLVTRHNFGDSHVELTAQMAGVARLKGPKSVHDTELSDAVGTEETGGGRVWPHG
jgi:hypothetical protein